MRIGSVEGSPEEIKDTLENHGLRIEDYLQVPSPRLELKWVIVPVILFILVLIVMAVGGWSSTKLFLLEILAGFGAGVWLVTSVQIRFGVTWASSMLGIGILLMLLMAANLISPLDTAELLRKMPQE